MSTPDDAAVIKMCLEGDSNAFGILIDRYQQPLYNTALRMTGDPEEAADISQETFVKAYQKLNEYRPDHKFFSWIYRILVNDTLNRLKQRNKTQGIEHEITSDERLPDEQFDAKRQSSRIESALRELAFDQRIVVVLLYFNDMSYQEMSVLLSVPEKTVKSRLYSARQNLASLLTRMGVVT
jgi:RNA polymerase sigma-70 factor (ECF subfamily)